MVRISDILVELKASRQEFAESFARAQDGFAVDQRKDFEAVGRSGVDRDAFEEALTTAQGDGWLDALIDTLIDAGLVNAEVVLARAKDLAATNAALQGIINDEAGIPRTAEHVLGMANGQRWVCKVLIDGVGKGTGVLVARNVVLTAWHVLRPLFKQIAPGQWESTSSTPGRLDIEFDETMFWRPATPAKSRLVAAQTNWCTAFSACHVDEERNLLPQTLTELDGKWDFALIHLAKPLPSTRGCARIDPRAAVPRAQQPISVFQYPGALLQRLASGKIVMPTDDATKAIVPRVRFMHKADAAPGSSGGPCFDRSFALIGIHQGSWTPPDAKDPINRGIPIARIYDQLKQAAGAYPPVEATDDLPLRMPGTDELLVGCGAFLSQVWSSAASADKALFVLSGPKGTGKTFLTRVLRHAALPSINHLPIVLDATQIGKKDVIGLVSHICKEAGVPEPNLIPPAQADTTVSAWLKNEVVPRLMEALQNARARRLVWLIVQRLDEATIDDKGASELLYLLYEQVLTHDWLRVVLDGMSGMIQMSLIPKLVPVDTKITEAEITRALERMLEERKVVLPPGVDTLLIAEPLHTMYTTWLDEKRETAVADLVLGIKAYAKKFIKEPGP